MKVAVGTEFPKAGDFCWDDETNPKRISIGIPSIGTVPLRVKRVKRVKEPGMPYWGWDGNIDYPTIITIIEIAFGTTSWRGYMLKGKLVKGSLVEAIRI